AIRMAMSKFSSPSHRAAARRVLVIIGSPYRKGNYSDPTQIAHKFRANGGTVITIEYVQEHDVSATPLETLASPNFSLTNRKGDGAELRAHDLRHLLCEANCFCKTNWMAYTTNKWNTPHGGCYQPSLMPSTQNSASQTCYRMNESVVVLDENSGKNAFLMNAFPPRTKIWLGLRYKKNKWTWPGGHSVGYTNWAPGQPNHRAGDCVYMEMYPESNSEDIHEGVLDHTLCVRIEAGCPESEKEKFHLCLDCVLRSIPKGDYLTIADDLNDH
ncbi:lectin C-type domain protein, partial [Teladorsagia circumcincta]